jgi:protocatechuate 3,4-dioxygenase beta subunit
MEFIMAHEVKKYWKLTCFLILVFVMAACASETPAPILSAPTQDVIVKPTETDIHPTDTQLPLPSATITEEPLTPTEPAPTATSTSIPVPMPITCDGVLTSAQQEGPFFSPGSPERDNLIEESMPGIPVMIIGRVFDQDCNPIPGVKLDFWLADVNGEYDNIGYTLRGHIYTDKDGYYSLESIEPTAYTGRPPHIHVKVYAPSGEELLTTQMYFAGSEGSSEVVNAPELFVNYLEPEDNGQLQVLFNFVVNDY